MLGPSPGTSYPDHPLDTMPLSQADSNTLVCLGLALPHFLYAYIWFFPQQWMAAFKKRSVEVFETLAWALKGAITRHPHGPMPCAGWAWPHSYHQIAWCCRCRGAVPVGGLLVAAAQARRRGRYGGAAAGLAPGHRAVCLWPGGWRWRCVAALDGHGSLQAAAWPCTMTPLCPAQLPRAMAHRQCRVAAAAHQPLPEG